MQIGVVGIDFHLSPLEVREKAAAFFKEHTFEGSVVLNTCNRTEVYFSSLNAASNFQALFLRLAPFDQKALYTYSGFECFFHLASVTTGLKSALFGETEIQGQVKSSYHNCALNAPLAKDLHFLFQKSLRIGKQIRKEMPLEKESHMIEEIVWELGKRSFVNPANAKVLFVGASEINQRLIEALKEKGVGRIAVCNRTESVAENLAHSAHILKEQFAHKARWLDYDWVFTATKAPVYLIKEEEVPANLQTKKLLIDLGVPRNIQPSVRNHANVVLCNIDDLASSKTTEHPLREIALDRVKRLTKKQYEIFQTRSQLKPLVAG